MSLIDFKKSKYFVFWMVNLAERCFSDWYDGVYQPFDSQDIIFHEMCHVHQEIDLIPEYNFPGDWIVEMTCSPCL